ncbi:MAG: type IV secretion system DNA-binding domain-containing protein [Chthoniobacteraceae bacterium]
MGQASSDWRDEKLAEQFYEWEVRGRGWQIFDFPVSPEPAFFPFPGYSFSESSSTDDGRRKTFLSSLVERLQHALAPKAFSQKDEAFGLAVEQPILRALEREDVTELVISLPTKVHAHPSAFQSIVSSIESFGEPLTYEMLGTNKTITPLFVTHPADASLIRHQLAAYIPEAVIKPQERMLVNVWDQFSESAVVEFGLSDEFMVPLANSGSDIFTEIAAAMGNLQAEELALFQIIFEPARREWTESAVRAVLHSNGKPFFANRADLVSGANKKFNQPLFAAVLRLAAQGDRVQRAWEIITQMAISFRSLSTSFSNALVPLQSEGYLLEDRIEDLLRRQSRRSGMLLNLEELSSLVHLPTKEVKKLVREIKTSVAAPGFSHERGLKLGTNSHAGETKEVFLSPEQRVRHTHIVGASGTGKSTLLFNLIRQDIENDAGLAVLDPHGDLVDRILEIIPPERIDDVVLIDPSDEEYSVGLNILGAHSDFEKSLLASDLVGVFRRLSTSWGDQMDSVLRNGILAFLESTAGGTLVDLRQFLLDTNFRNRFLRTVTDPEIIYYWQKVFPQLSGNKSIGPVITRLDEFLSRKPIRYMVSQKENRVNFSEILDRGHILLARLPQGLIGRENSQLLGSLLLGKLQQMAMSRQRMRENERRDFWCYVDEFPSFMTPSMAEILTGARKYRMGLTLAHQEMRQLQADSEVASAVMSNCLTRVAFRVSDADARSLENGFTQFEARDLQNLETGEAVCRIERSDADFNLTISRPDLMPDDEDIRDEVIAASRSKYSQSRAAVEAELRRYVVVEELKPEPPPKRPKGVPNDSEPSSASKVPKDSEPNDTRPDDALPELVIEVEPLKPIARLALPPKSEQEDSPKPAPPKSAGRGGKTHKALQDLIKRSAQDLGYLAVVEYEIAGGHVDVALQRNQRTIACEISITTPIEHEIGNIKKCLSANFAFVALVIRTEKRLTDYQAAISAALSTRELERVRFLLPDGLLTFLKELAAEDSGSSKTVRGYKVKVRHHVVDDMSEEDRIKELAKILGRSAKKRKKD